MIIRIHILGKSESIWDRLTHTRSHLIIDGSNGDIADNSYYMYKTDVQILRQLGVDFYRFSVSWTRILPTSFPDKINKAGVAYYNKLIDELLKYNIKPVLTIFHWDLPQKLQELGGWANPYIIDWYADYARILFKLFGDRVKYWVTINEPHQTCYYAYGDTILAPALNIKGVAEYLCAKNLLLAHAKAYHIYDKIFRPKQKGIIFIALSAMWYEPLFRNQPEAARDANYFEWEQYSHPIFSKTGDFPPAMKKRIAARSAEQGFPKSRLPEFTPSEIELLKGSSDFFGLNHYSTRYVYRNNTVNKQYESPSYDDDLAVHYYEPPEWNIGRSKFTKFVPWGFYKLLTYIRKEYDNPPVYIAENGFSTLGGLNDGDRVLYYTEYLSAMLDAMEEGSDVRAYTAWSLMDNFEWSRGYKEKFGLYEVDYSSPNRTRTPRKSAHLLSGIFHTHLLYRCRAPGASPQQYFCFKVLISQCSMEPEHKCQVRKFPKGFLFGAATSSYQIEGAWDADGKTESIWDHMTHTRPDLISDGSTGDIAVNSYYLYKRDVEMLRELGVDFYRFSLSWTRILPTSFPDKINEAGVAYYNNLIDELLKNNIEPMVTIFHWDLPQRLQELGGWVNPHIVDWFGDYARTVFTLFGDRVKYWITINEPHAVCHYSYGHTFLAPALDFKGVPEYICAKNLLLAHATAYHIYDQDFRPKQKGIIFISFSAQWYEPLTESDAEVADEANQFERKQYTDPIFSKTGDFPPAMKRRIAARSAEQGFFRSRLPELTQDEIEFIRGSSDIFGLNHYFSNYVNRNDSVNGYYESPSFKDDLAVFYTTLPEWNLGDSDFMKCVPWGFYKLLTHIRKDYGNPTVFITENGFPTRGGLNDDVRITYYTEYMSAMLDAMEEGSDVRAYTAWSLMDNYEWSRGYIEKFGLYEVDYSSRQLTRTPRKSAYFMKEVFRTHELRRCNNTQIP
ncbi:lactase/phlorizin hydrolase [Bicyclus anynana]|uniref:Lactase/phlorizin hydrolase n=1 Tax=Bicyclus anynana TaxID=110368 RepID=A0A6J1P0J4_BICAN|nr:lactase/phlorizin hydrolase [Bicyclus anynana]